jgi:hypothetical protein
MAQQTGTISEWRSVDFNGTPLWSFKLEGEDTWYRTGTDKTTWDVGNDITFIHRNLQVNVKSIVPKGTADPSAGTVTVEEVTPSVPRGTPTENTNQTDVAKRIQWQAARADATRIIEAALKLEDAAGDVKGVLPWAKNVAKAKKLDLLVGYITQLTKQFIEEENNG